MRSITAHPWLLALLLTACGGSDDDGATDDSTGGGGEGWSIAYTGDLEGEISGSSAVVLIQTLSQTSVSVAGDSLEGPSFSASYSYPTDGDPLGAKSPLSFRMELADGTECGQTPPDQMATITVLDGAEDTYHAEISGTLSCDGSVVTLDGWVQTD